MRVAHGAGRGVRDRHERDRQMQRVHLPRQRHVAPAEARGAHIGAPEATRQALHRQVAGDGAHHDAVLAGLVRDKGGDAARGIAAGAGLGAVGVQDAHEDVGALARRLHDDQLVEADAGVAVADGAGGVRRHRDGPGARIQHDEVVAEPVHLSEGDHGFRI